MSLTTILYPAFAMFLLSMICISIMGVTRYLSIQKREVKMSFYQSYNKGSQPERLHIIARHAQNHFEVPPIFYVGIIIAYITETVSMAAVVFAWLFVAARVLHTYIHLGKNNVSVRFFTFGGSLICLMGLWISVFYGIVQSSGL